MAITVEVTGGEEHDADRNTPACSAWRFARRSCADALSCQACVIGNALSGIAQQSTCDDEASFVGKGALIPAASGVLPACRQNLVLH